MSVCGAEGEDFDLCHVYSTILSFQADEEDTKVSGSVADRKCNHLISKLFGPGKRSS